MTLGEWLRGFKDQSIVEPVVKLCGFDSTDEMADYINEILSRDVDIAVTDEELALGRSSSARIRTGSPAILSRLARRIYSEFIAVPSPVT